MCLEEGAAPPRSQVIPLKKQQYIVYVYYGMGNYSAQSAVRGRPNAAAAAPQIGINFSRREGASPEPRRLSRPKGTRGGGNETGEELTNNVGRGRAPRA